jgi:RsiW-degrading membrane proteinase PrsW (M82 family)
VGSLLVIGSVLAAVVPMVALLAIVWWLDRYDREPVWLLAMVFTWGAVGAVLLALPTTLVVHGSMLSALTLLEAPLWLLERVAVVLVAPVAEEPAKGIVLLMVLFHRHFDNMTDGFVYGAAAGLGFGMTENLLFFLDVADDPSTWGSTVAVRTLYSALMHTTATATLGAALGHARFRGTAALVGWGALGLVGALAVHGLWNALASSPSEGLWLVDRLLLPAEALLAFGMFQLCLLEESRTIRTELLEEVQRGVLPPGHPDVLASWWRRTGTGWLPPHVDHDTYVRLATELAMRKRQRRELGERAPLFYGADVHRLRGELHDLLAPDASLDLSADHPPAPPPSRRPR